MPEVLRAIAHAKVNLVLEVLGVRPDGYHEIDTILQEVELGDVVAVEPSRDWSISVTGRWAAGTPADDSNLALRAARLLAESAGHAHEPATIRLEKHIPPAGGLGGGASDAAATLKLLAKLWPGLTGRDLQAVAEAVGSDEPFFLVGGTARARGRGERVEALADLPSHDVVLFVPGQSIERKTARMFAALDRHPFDDGVQSAAFPIDASQPFRSDLVFNAFERVAFDLFPWLADLWADLEARTRMSVRLCGAGPCLFWIGREGEGHHIAERAAGADCDVILTRTVGRQ